MENKDMNQQKPESTELSMEEMKKAAGGCLFYCRMDRKGFRQKGTDVYEFYKCQDCGKEKYLKNGEEIFASEYFNV